MSNSQTEKKLRISDDLYSELKELVKNQPKGQKELTQTSIMDDALRTWLQEYKEGKRDTALIPLTEVEQNLVRAVLAMLRAEPQNKAEAGLVGDRLGNNSHIMSVFEIREKYEKSE